MDYKLNNEKNFQPFQPTNIISDFFITESTQPSININNDNIKLNNQKSNNIEFDEINDDFLKEFLNTHLTDINSITEFNKKIKQNKNINDEFDINLIYPQKKSSKEELFLDDIRKAENIKNKKKEKKLFHKWSILKK